MGRFATLLGITLAGVAAGVAAKAADESTIGWASDLGTYPAVWVLVIAVIGRLAPSGAWAAVRGTGFFAAMVAAYYAWSYVVLGYPVDRWLGVWTALAVTAVPMLAAACRWATRRSGAVPGVTLGAVAGAVLAGGAIHQLWMWALGELPPDFPLRPVQALTDGMVALVIAGVLPTSAPTRIWALSWRRSWPRSLPSAWTRLPAASSADGPSSGNQAVDRGGMMSPQLRICPVVVWGCTEFPSGGARW